VALDYSFCQGLRGTPCVRIYDEVLRGKTPQYVIWATDAMLPRTRWACRCYSSEPLKSMSGNTPSSAPTFRPQQYLTSNFPHSISYSSVLD